METRDIKEQFIDLRAKGYSFERIAKKLGKARQTLVDWSKDLQEEIANRKALELEVLYEKYYLLRENRLQTFGEMLSKLRKEVEARDLSQLPTDKLLDLYLKYNATIKEELVEPVFKSSGEIAEEEAERRLLSKMTESPQEDKSRLKAV